MFELELEFALILFFFLLLFALPLGAVYCHYRRINSQDANEITFWRFFCIGLTVFSIIYILSFFLLYLSSSGTMHHM